MAAKEPSAYRAEVGLDLPKAGRIEAGETFTAVVPKEFIEQGLVTPLDTPEAAQAADAKEQ